jgi:hypothetical protein
MDLPIITLPAPELDRLEDEILTLCGHINAAEYRFLKLLADYDRAEAWSRHGVASCVQWLNWQCGIGAVAARERVRTARALEALPLISAAFSRGELSYSKVRAMTRVATPENESTLLTIALHGTASHVEKLVRKYRWVRRQYEAERVEDQYRERYWIRSGTTVHWSFGPGCPVRSVRSSYRPSKRRLRWLISPQLPTRALFNIWMRIRLSLMFQLKRAFPRRASMGPVRRAPSWRRPRSPRRSIVRSVPAEPMRSR